MNLWRAKFNNSWLTVARKYSFQQKYARQLSSYHLAHHLFPRVPFWHMPQLNKLLRRDAVYRACDDACGGIFLSSNDAPSLVAQMVRDELGGFPHAAASDASGERG